MLLSNLIVSACALNSVAASPVTLRYKFHVGEVISYKSNVSMDLQTSGQGSNVPLKFSLPSSTTMKIKSVGADGTATLVMESTMGAMAGASKQAKPMTVTMKLSPTGQMSGMQMNGTSQSSSKLASSLPSLQVMKALPQQPINVGSHWDSTTNMAMLGDITIHNVVDKITSAGGSTIVTFHTNGSADLAKLAGALGGGAKDVTGSITFGGQTNFNATRGFYEDSTIHAKMSMSGTAQGKAMHVSGTITFDMKKTG